jgi:mannonate dehydratase
MHIHAALPNLAENTLRYYRQIGIEDVTMPAQYTESGASRPLVPPAQKSAPPPLPPAWDIDQLLRISSRIRAFDLNPACMDLPLSADIMMGRAGAGHDLDTLCGNIECAATVGIKVVTYSFNALRASAGYAAVDGAGRGQARLRTFDHTSLENLPALSDVGEIGEEQMWNNLCRFLSAVVPTAERSGVILASHPNDPPVPSYRHVAQPLYNLDSWKRMIEFIDSPSNCLFFDTGVTTELAEDPVEVIQYFGHRKRIGMVHFRNVIVQVPYLKYIETFIDEGDCNMSNSFRALQEVGYTGGIDPDHTPGITGDCLDSRQGWAYAVGYMRALRASVTESKSTATNLNV